MSPDLRQANAQPTTYTHCIECGEPLSEGDPYTCRPCVRAAYTACREIKGRAILPSDIAAIRRRDG